MFKMISAIQLWIDLKQNLCNMLLLIVLLRFPGNYAEVTEVSGYGSPACTSKCGCDGISKYYVYDAAKDECVYNKGLMKSVVVYYDNQSDEGVLAVDGMAKDIYVEGQKIFQGIMVSVILFITCAAICVVSACVYCCRINYSDRKLKKSVKALAKKMNKNLEKRPPQSKKVEAKAENCNVVVADADVFVV